MNNATTMRALAAIVVVGLIFTAGSLAAATSSSSTPQPQNLICTHPCSGATCVSDPGNETPTTGTLLVKKVVVCEPMHICPEPQAFHITVTGNNPSKDSFLGSESGTLVTLGVGPYKVSEDRFTSFKASFSDDCTGTIAAGDQKTCTITNTEQVQ